jgi:hypothetical protein
MAPRLLTHKIPLVEYFYLLQHEPFLLVYAVYPEHADEKYEDEFRPKWIEEQYLATLPDSVLLIVLNIVESEGVYAHLCTDEAIQIRSTPSWVFHCHGKVTKHLTLCPHFEKAKLTAFFDTCVRLVSHPQNPDQLLGLGLSEKLKHRAILRQRWTVEELEEIMQMQYSVDYVLLYFSYGPPDVSHFGQSAITYCTDLPDTVQVIVIDAKEDARVFEYYRKHTVIPASKDTACLSSVPCFCLYSAAIAPEGGYTQHKPLHIFSAAHNADDEENLHQFMCDIKATVMKVSTTTTTTTALAPLKDVLDAPEKYDSDTKHRLIDEYLEDMAYNMSLATCTRHRLSIRRILGTHDLKTLERCSTVDDRQEKKDTYIALFKEWARANYRMVFGKQMLPFSSMKETMYANSTSIKDTTSLGTYSERKEEEDDDDELDRLPTTTTSTKIKPQPRPITNTN